MAPCMSPAWCNPTPRRISASGGGWFFAIAIQTTQPPIPSALPQALMLSSVCQDLPNRRVEFRRAEVELAEPRVERDFAIAADQVEAAGPSLVRGFGGAIHAVYHGGERKIQLAHAERGVILLLSQRASRRQRDAFFDVDRALPLAPGASLRMGLAHVDQTKIHPVSLLPSATF